MDGRMRGFAGDVDEASRDWPGSCDCGVGVGYTWFVCTVVVLFATALGGPGAAFGGAGANRFSIVFSWALLMIPRCLRRSSALLRLASCNIPRQSVSQLVACNVSNYCIEGKALLTA